MKETILLLGLFILTSKTVNSDREGGLLKKDSGKLRLINESKLVLHEAYERNRINEILESFSRSNMLFNPIITTRLKGDRYLVLDGVHRLLALKQIGITNIPTQIIENNQFQLNSWKHLVERRDWFKTVNNYLIEYSGSHDKVYYEGTTYILKYQPKNILKWLVFGMKLLMPI